MFDQDFLESAKDIKLFEVLLVLIVLFIVLLASAYELWQVQVRTAWDADALTLKKVAEIAEIYVMTEDKVDTGVSILELIDHNFIEDQVLNRRSFYRKTGSWKSCWNRRGKKISEICMEERVPRLLFDHASGSIANLKLFIISLIGLPPYVKNVDDYLDG